MSDPEPPVSPAPDRLPPPGWEAALLIAGLVLLTAGLFWWARRAPAPSAARAGFVGDRECRACHPGESAAHHRSGHARTLRPAASTAEARQLDGTSVADPERPDVTWSYHLRDGQLTVERRAAGAVERFVLEYAFGSGHHATTFVTLDDHDPAHPVAFEHRLTLFAHAPKPKVTPGQSLLGHASGNSPRGRTHTPENTLKCFECHTTRTSDQGPGMLDIRQMVPNIGCERCHGPGAAHAEAARRGAEGAALAMPFGYDGDAPIAQTRFCGGCHRLPEMVTPGSIRTDNPVLVRHQSVGLIQSACFRGSRGALTCSTCHDPHSRTSRDRGAYEAVCLMCHQAPRTVCPVAPESGCLDCHMPRRDVARGMLMTDHWIRIIREGEPTPAPGPDTRHPDESSHL